MHKCISIWLLLPCEEGNVLISLKREISFNDIRPPQKSTLRSFYELRGSIEIAICSLFINCVVVNSVIAFSIEFKIKKEQF